MRLMLARGTQGRASFSSSSLLSSLGLIDTKCMILTYEPALEPLHAGRASLALQRVSW